MPLPSTHRPPAPSAVDARPTVAELHGDSVYANVARRNWLSPSTITRVLPDVLTTEIWQPLEKEKFPFRSLLVLENLQLLEKYLWPGYSEEASNVHVLLIALMVNVKSRENLPLWVAFADRPLDFSNLFRRVLSMCLDTSLPTSLQTDLLSFIIGAFQSLDNGLVRRECAPLVSISVWQNLSSERVRDRMFQEYGQLRKAWRAVGKRFEAADEGTKDRLKFDRMWLFSMLMNFLSRLYVSERDSLDNLLYCERFLEFLTDLESQLPTRRYVNTLLDDLNLLPALRMSPLYNDEDNGLLRDLYSLLRHFATFSIDDIAGAQYSQADAYDKHCKTLAELQRTALKHFKSKLTVLALANYASIDQRDELESHFSTLTDDELTQFCALLGYRTTYPSNLGVTVDRRFLLEVLLSTHERRKTFQDVAKQLSTSPTETTLYEQTLLRNETYSGARPLAIPKLNLQYLTIGDFLWRSFILHRCETFFEIRKDMEDAVKRLRPSVPRQGGDARFEGFSRMALPISKPAIVEVTPPKVGQDQPVAVRAEISLDTSSLTEAVRREWDSLRPEDVVFLLTVTAPQASGDQMDGDPEASASEQAGIKCLRVAEVVQVLDDNGRAIKDASHLTNGDGYSRRSQNRRLVVHLDAKAYQLDRDSIARGRADVYNTMNLIVRRRGRENNFKPILNSIRSLTLSNVPMPAWLQEVFLGYGDPTSATYTHLANRLKAIDFRDTFLDWQHLVQSMPGKSVEPSDDMDSSFGPPYVLEVLPDDSQAAPKPSKKRRRDEAEPGQIKAGSVKATTYKPPNNGPYPVDTPRTNQVRFTPTQVEAIISGTQPGLTVIVGPPGTGKTDVATQIINNLYHNFPNQRTLLIAHSNQALNQLFQKIIALDIDERHLLRLGHGEENLVVEGSYSKYGRVESFLENRTHYLSEVNRLAASLGAPGAHGNSCETADYFNSVYIKPAWTKFNDLTQAFDVSNDDIVDNFPFQSYFSNAPQPLFPPGASVLQLKDIANGCYRHIDKIFTELEDIRPFEILRSSRDKANYLLIKEARIIAMTSTHAAMRRQEITNLGFHYDNVVMEEAAQITEIENFIPLALQSPRHGELPLQRVVLCGDHLQNSPIIQNLAFRQYANLEQSLFRRLVRLGVPTINLDQQGRARSSIAELYRWRYERLGDLPVVEVDPQFKAANAGFRYEYQFIDVPDYKGAGESEPTPHFIQNLGEAEYAVAIYQYMRLLGYPSSSVSILTTYAGQRQLIRDVLNHRCAKNRLFGLPKIVTTVDQYQGEQNDYVILSLTRTNRVGYLRDIRRLTVALSRARLGLYILGRREVFESCFELKPAFDRLARRPDRLMLTTGEMYPSSRQIGDEVDATEMHGVEHLGQYVFEMTQAKVAALKAEAEVGAAPAVPESIVLEENGDDEIDAVAEYAVAEDEGSVSEEE
ncbi:MAG: hypothetical protein M1833_003910 [Piccolia ochrophora]|nr:MAG: hypothetical protein M1833_003910 [Piccolia ochrophora]